MHPNALIDACAQLVKLTLTFEHPADAVVSRFFRDNRGLGQRERAALAETTYTVLRKKLLFDHMVPSGSGPRERRMAILGFAHWQDEEARRTSPQAAQAAREFLQGGLSDRERQWLAQCDAVVEDDLLERHRHNLPEWIAAPLKEQLGPDFWPLVKALGSSAPLDLRVNALKDKRPQVQAELAQAGIKTEATPYSPWGLRAVGKPQLSKLPVFTRGAIEVQDEGSQLLALLVDAKRGEMVVDFCAGAGGKTLALGASMRSTGRLYAFDVAAHRLDALKPRLARSGLSNVHPAAIAHERDDRVKRLSGKIDRVLVDAPCSGLGTLRRNPDLKWRQSPKAIEELTAKQTAILAGAARLLKPGGRLVYATCSVLQQENEAIAEAFSAAHPDFLSVDAGDVLAQLKVEAAAGLCGGGETGARYLRLWPHVHHTDGFFAAVWERKA